MTSHRTTKPTLIGCCWLRCRSVPLFFRLKLIGEMPSVVEFHFAIVNVGPKFGSSYPASCLRPIQPTLLVKNQEARPIGAAAGIHSHGGRWVECVFSVVHENLIASKYRRASIVQRNLFGTTNHRRRLRIWAASVAILQAAPSQSLNSSPLNDASDAFFEKRKAMSHRLSCL